MRKAIIMKKDKNQQYTDINGTIWYAGKHIGSGGFGDVYEANVNWVIKIEPIKNRQLRNELITYLKLKSVTDVPDLVGFGSTEDERFIVLPRFSQTLDRKFDIKNLGGYVKDIIDVLERIHNKGIYHGDIKPSNVVITKANRATLIDYGLSGQLSTRKYHPWKFAGSLPYASVDQHLKRKPSRRSDLESLGWLLCGVLNRREWQRLDFLPVKLLAKKQPEEFFDECLDGELAFQAYLRYVWSLDYLEIPNYSFLKSLF